MKLSSGAASCPADCNAEATDLREELVRRVGSSVTFERSPKLREFLYYVCRCAIDEQPGAATEQQVGINVFRRSPGYNPNDDNIVRSQARLLRLKLEHHFANEGRDEPVVITIPKGRYLPAFVERAGKAAPQAAESISEAQSELHLEPAAHLPEPLAPAPVAPVLLEQPEAAPFLQRNRNVLAGLGAAAAVVAGILLFTRFPVVVKHWLTVSAASGASAQPQLTASMHNGQPLLSPLGGGLRIIAGRTGAPVVDMRGEQWYPDEFYAGGVSRSGPPALFTGSASGELFKSIREGASEDSLEPQQQSEFHYDIPAAPGTYELRLYFADPARNHGLLAVDGSQNLRHFGVNLNGRPLLSGFDAIADAGAAAVDVRAFKDITPAADGQVHLEFLPEPERPFVSALELIPGVPGLLKPIRIAAQRTGFVDKDGVQWSPDDFFLDGRAVPNSAEASHPVPELYRGERIGNFSYAIPVPQGSYTVKLHFMEGFFGSPAGAGNCANGSGCRIFDVSCNGALLLRDFDIYHEAGGAFRPIVRTFRGLKPNGQGKIRIDFSPKVNYAEVRAIEVIDEAK